MTTAIKTAKKIKTVQVIARIVFRADIRKVCYQVKSSNGKDIYMTCLFKGMACSCTCPAQGLNCYHCTQCEAIEAAREEARKERTRRGCVAEAVYQIEIAAKEREAVETARAYRDMAWDSRF